MADTGEWEPPVFLKNSRFLPFFAAVYPLFTLFGTHSSLTVPLPLS